MRTLLPALLLACHGAADPVPTRGQDTPTPPTPRQPTTPVPTNDDTDDTAQPAPVAVPGLHAEYFLDYLDLALTRVEPSLDHVWDCGPDPALPCDGYSARWTGTLTPPETALYTLSIDSDDGVRLWLDGQLLIEDWTGHFVTRNSAQVSLEANVPVDLRIDYFELDLEASMRLSWSTDTRPEEVIGEAHLSTFDLPSDRPGPKPDYLNPVIPFDCPDPGVIAAPEGGEHPSELPFYAVCTGGTFPLRTSRGLVSWEATGVTVLPAGKPSWAANGGRNWAPELHWVGSDLVAYYTSVDGSNVLSIGAANAPGPEGPFTDRGAPLVQDPDGVIDATFFEDDDGSRWLLYKIDGNAHGEPTPIFLRPLAADGLSFTGAPIQVLVNTPGSWEGGVVEAPWLIHRDGWYYLFYSGNVYDARYRTGVARSATLEGPYTKRGDPLLTNNERWVGAGHGSVVQVGDDDYLVYHAWTNDGAGGHRTDLGRHVLVDRITYVDGWPQVHDGSPSRTRQPWPGTSAP